MTTDCEKCKTLVWCGDHGSDGVVAARDERIAEITAMAKRAGSLLENMLADAAPCLTGIDYSDLNDLLVEIERL